MRVILQEIREKINPSTYLNDPAIFMALLLILVAVASFGLGRQSVSTGNTPEKPQKSTNSSQSTTSTPSRATDTETPAEGTYYVASKNGSVYHLPYCSGAKRISEQNKIVFKTKAEAEAAGLRPAANCPGI